MNATALSSKRKLVPEMEGATARWYARLRASPAQMETYRTQAVRLTRHLPDGARVLEVAPGPGYHAIEIAKLGRFEVVGLDISRTLVEIASEGARRAGINVDFRYGDVANMPFEAESFDLITCQAAFKNFAQPVRALEEMHRVLRPGGMAVIDDLNREISTADIDAEVRRQGLGRLNGFATKWILGTMLRRRAYSAAQFGLLARQSAFGACDVRTEGIGLEVRLSK
jgi:ubiquinone/menaquinone biosynthesis C-methylase UbiE